MYFRTGNQDTRLKTVGPLCCSRYSLRISHRESETFGADVVLERSGSQHFNSPVVGQHVRQVQTQLGVAVEGGGSAGLRCAANLDAAAILFRVNSNGTGADDDVAGLVT